MVNAGDSHVVDVSRLQVLNEKSVVSGRYVLYWMQQSQRAEDNPALEYAIEAANHFDLPVLAVFGLTDNYPEANVRHYTFMLEGLKETRRSLRKRGIKIGIQRGDPAEVALGAGRRAAMIVCDRGYLRLQKEWRRRVARQAPCRVVQVESDVIVPVDVVSTKAEYAARTIRPKILRLADDYLQPATQLKVKRSSLDVDIPEMDIDDIDAVLKRLKIDKSVPAVSHWFRGGASVAKERFASFLAENLKHYDRNSNQPQTDDISCMSPYLHFGQISPVYLALKARKADKRKVGRTNTEAFLEQLLVRRELAMNFVHFTRNYDAYGCIPRWAQQTLAAHASDPRPYLYSRDLLDAAQTHDPYWNAAMMEMKHTGFMHNYMRMYWGKKILEWCKTPEEAHRITLALNNRYFLDGRDANSYTGVAWLYGIHDRAWPSRPVFGKIRSMTAAGLERKCDIRGYVEKVKRLADDGVPK